MYLRAPTSIDFNIQFVFTPAVKGQQKVPVIKFLSTA